MKRTTAPYELVLEDYAPSPDMRPMICNAKIIVNERVVARTTLDPGTTADHPDAQRFVDQHFHRPSSPRNKRRPPPRAPRTITTTENSHDSKARRRPRRSRRRQR